MSNEKRTERARVAAENLFGHDRDCKTWPDCSIHCHVKFAVRHVIDPLLDAVAREARESALEAAAKIAESSDFVDGPQGTIEGQIAKRIRTLGGSHD